MAQAAQKPVIQVSTDTPEESKNMAEIAVSSNIVGKDGVASRREAANDIEVLKRVVTRGEAGNYAAMFLALRQIPFASPAGDDNIREMSAQMLQVALKATDPKARTITFCPQSGSCNSAPLTNYEVEVASGGGRTGDLVPASMNPSRGLPINRAVAAMTGFLDAQMNTARFLPVKPNGQRMTLPETVTDLQTRHPAAVTNEKLASCVANENNYTIAECAIVGVRAGVTFNNESGVRYNGAQFLGTPQLAGQRR